MPNLLEVVQPKKSRVSLFMRRPYHHIRDGIAYGDAFVSVWDIHLTSKIDDVVRDGKSVRVSVGTFRRYMRVDFFFFIVILKWNFDRRQEKVEQKKKGLADILKNAQTQKNPGKGR